MDGVLQNGNSEIAESSSGADFGSKIDFFKKLPKGYLNISLTFWMNFEAEMSLSGPQESCENAPYQTAPFTVLHQNTRVLIHSNAFCRFDWIATSNVRRLDRTEENHQQSPNI